MAMNLELQFLHICTNYSISNFRRLKCFFLYSKFCTDVFTVSCKLFQRPRVCYLRMKWLRGRESEWVFSSRWSHCGYTTIETLWFFFQGKKRRFFNRWSNFTKQQRERRRAFVGSLERMLVSSMLNNWKQHVKENKALRWVGRSWVTLELLLHVVKWPNCWRARAWVERPDRFSLAKLFSCKISVHDPLVALNYSCNLEPFANTENWSLLSCAIE